MLETMTSFILAEHLAGRSFIPEQGDVGYTRLTSDNRRPYETSDGYLVIFPSSTKHWIGFFDSTNNVEWQTAEKVTEPVVRSQYVDELFEKVAALAQTKSTAQ